MFGCARCQRRFTTQNGLAIHLSRAHDIRGTKPKKKKKVPATLTVAKEPTVTLADLQADEVIAAVFTSVYPKGITTPEQVLRFSTWAESTRDFFARA